MADNNISSELVPVSITVEAIRDKIYVIRDRKVMLDRDLAAIYGYETKNFNRQVRNNIEKFYGDDFMFQLDDDDLEELSRCKNFTLNENTGRGHNIKYKPYAFTEQGIYMLMTVLKGELATHQSRELVKAFKKMKDYIQTVPVLSSSPELLQLSLQTAQNVKDISEIKEKMITKDDLTKVIESFSLPDKDTDYLIFSGQYLEAKAAYKEIYGKAKKKIYIVDNYIDIRTLVLLNDISGSVEVIVFSDNIGRNLSLADFNMFRNQYPGINIKMQRTGGRYHDRYIVLDYKCNSEKIYHCGASSKDAGRLVTTITKADNKKLYYPMVDDLLQQPLLRLR